MNALPQALPQAGADYSFAFQPIVDCVSGGVFAHEALVRGPAGESAWSVIGRVTAPERAAFDRDCRAAAVRTAARTGMTTHLSLNALPSALLDRQTGLESTLAAAADCGFPAERIIVEITESELLRDPISFAAAMNRFRGAGLKFAIDDFGAGYSGLNLLADFQPEMVKLDMGLCRGIDRHGPRQAIVRGIIQVCLDLSVDLVAEGVETLDEYRWLTGQGVLFMQGFILARAGFESLPAVTFPDGF